MPPPPRPSSCPRRASTTPVVCPLRPPPPVLLPAANGFPNVGDPNDAPTDPPYKHQYINSEYSRFNNRTWRHIRTFMLHIMQRDSSYHQIEGTRTQSTYRKMHSLSKRGGEYRKQGKGYCSHINVGSVAICPISAAHNRWVESVLLHVESVVVLEQTKSSWSRSRTLGSVALEATTAVVESAENNRMFV